MPTTGTRMIRKSLDSPDETPGHDAWTVGDEACVVVDWAGFGDYAKGS